MSGAVMALNAGSSSVKFAIAPIEAVETPILDGAVERLGGANASLEIREKGGGAIERALGGADHARALDALFGAIAELWPELEVRAVGHRIVHGGARFAEPAEITQEVVNALEALIPLAPLHQPAGIEGARAARAAFPDALQAACFDTAFHAGKSWEQDAFALPRRFYDEGLRRYGFHGLACASVCNALERAGDPLAKSRIAIAHLGNGCSVTAVREGRSVANSMGFSALDGLAMGARCGRIDPGALLHLLRSGWDVARLERLLYHEAGLLGMSGLSNDMRDLLASDAEPARRAIDYFVTRAVEEICRMAGAMGGLEGVVFSGGIGENAPPIREAILAGLAFLPGAGGDGLDVRIQPADEERELLRSARDLLGSACDRPKR